MATASATLCPPAPMIIDTESGTNSIRWTNWLRRFAGEKNIYSRKSEETSNGASSRRTSRCHKNNKFA
jgi:hypothetical protein